MNMMRFPSPSRRSPFVSCIKQMKLCLSCLWLLRAMVLAKVLKAPSSTLDAPQSAEIRALAAELGNNPYRIHQWVYDNIRFFPSYGSVQGAEETLAKKNGNAFDIASLLIALLRSAGIESRYVYGTVQIPSEQAMNWVGGVKTPEVAQQIGVEQAVVLPAAI
jgi:transglutaminase-like putative cysteine protease